MIDYNEINDLIIKVFNYYNGKINVINKTVLDINWCNLMGNNHGGYSKLPNIVTINPMVIIRFYDNDEHIIKVAIIETIIHELYHSDQIINYNLYHSDVNYNQYIEHACQLQTVIYMAGHSQEIYNLFGVDTSIDKNQYNEIINYWWYPGINYQRRYFNDHVFMCLDNLAGFGKENGNIIYDLINIAIEDEIDIIVNINDEIIPVYVNGDTIDINNFNNIISKFKCNGSYDAYYKIDSDENGNLIIIIKMQVMNLMCKKI